MSFVLRIVAVVVLLAGVAGGLELGPHHVLGDAAPGGRRRRVARQGDEGLGPVAAGLTIEEAFAHASAGRGAKTVILPGAA